MTYSKYNDGDTIYLSKHISNEDYLRYVNKLRRFYGIKYESRNEFNRIIKYGAKE